MKKILILVSVLLTLTGISAKRPAKHAAAAPKLSPYEKLFKNKNATTAKGGMMTVHLVDNKVYLEFPIALLEKEMMIGSIATKSGDPTICVPGQQPRPPIAVRFVLADSVLSMHRIALRFAYTTDDKRTERLISTHSKSAAETTFPVKAYTPDSSAVVIDASELFLAKWKELSPINDGYGKYDISASADSKIARLRNVAAYDDRICVDAQLQYTANMWYSIIPIARGIIVPVEVRRSLYLLSKSTMKSRKADPRLNLLGLTRKVLSNEGDVIRTEQMAARWDIRPIDPDALHRGELSAPQNPIIMYLDPQFPQAWKQPISEGILAWNKAFEAIGLKEVIRVEEATENESGLKHPSICYAPSHSELCHGNPWFNPASGQIISGNIVIHRGIAAQIYKERFIQTAAADPRMQRRTLPKELLFDALRLLATREMGHILGLTNNYSSSATYAVDSLRSASFIRRNGLSPSIMDAVPYNYIAQKGDSAIYAKQPSLGVADYFAIRYLYKPLSDSLSAQQYIDTLKKWADETDRDLRLRYISSPKIPVSDPSYIPNDLGDDPLLSGTYGIANLRQIVAHINEWIPATEDPDGEHRRMLMTEITKRYQQYIRNAETIIGGFRLSESGVRYQPLPAEMQRKAVHWIFNQLRDSEWLNASENSETHKIEVPAGLKMCDLVMYDLKQRYAPIALCAHLSDDPYTASDFVDDLYTEIWQAAIENRPLTRIDRIWQSDMLSNSKILLAATGSPKFFTTPEFQALQSTNDEIATKSVEFQSEHLLTMIRKLQKLLALRIVDAAEIDRPHYRAMKLFVDRALSSR